MKLTLSSDALKKALGAVQSLITEHQVLLTADSDTNQLTIEAGHDGVYLKQRIKCEVESDGSTVLNSSYLSSLRLGSVVSLQKNGNSLAFTSGKLSGKIETHQSSQKIIDQRNQEEIETKASVSKDMLYKAIQRNVYGSITVQSQEGLKVRFDEFLTISTTDSYRLSLCKDRLPYAIPPLEFTLNREIFLNVVAKIEEPEVLIGTSKGTIKISSPSFEFYHPTLQTEATDVESWVKDLNPNEKLGEVRTNAQELVNLITSVGSIAKAANDEVNINCKIKGDILSIYVGAVHGSASGEISLTHSDVLNLSITLSYRYTAEMLYLLKEENIDMIIYEPYVIFRTTDGRCLNLVPTKTV